MYHQDSLIDYSFSGSNSLRMQPRILLLSYFLVNYLLVEAQNEHRDSGYIIFTLGRSRDTVEIAHYRLVGDEFTATIVQRANSNVNRVKGRFSPSGELQYMEGYRYKPAPGREATQLLSFRLFQKGDSTVVEEKTGEGVNGRTYAGTAMVYFWPYVHMTVILAHYVPNVVGDSIEGNQIIGDLPVGKFVLKRLTKEKIMAYSRVMGRFTLYVKQFGKVDSIDAIGSSYNVKGTVIPCLNLDSIIQLYASREERYGPYGWPNKSDSVLAVIGKNTIRVSYTRPSMRGRVIFGEVVPWNSYWRTGANRATKITTNGPLDFDGKILPAGEYSIFTLPSPAGWIIMFNREANIWGTDYNPTHDILRVPMQLVRLDEPVELMTIEVAPTENGGAINIIWENVKASAYFTFRD
jgi:hypothetical protein